MVKDIDPGSAGSYPDNLANVSGTLFFTANYTTGSDQLWKTNGTSAGTVLVKDLSSDVGDFTNVNGTLFFVKDIAPYGLELWKSDGTAGGTVKVTALNNLGGRPHGREREVVLLGFRWLDGRGALEERRHLQRHHARQGHLPRRHKCHLHQFLLSL
jgi:ELWxxDGT repeat protein